MNAEKKFHQVMILSVVLLVFCFLAALCMGRYSIPISTVFAELMGNGDPSSTVHTVIFNVRIPRMILSILAGAGLSAAGLAFQCLFSNPLATPDTLGTAEGASFGAALGILLGFQSAGVQALSLIMGAAAVALVFLVAGKGNGRSRSMIYVILAGMVISSLFRALVSLTKYAADPQDQLPVITFWLMGSFSGITKRSLLTSAPLILAGLLILTLLRFRLNVLSLSEEEAKSLGMNLKQMRILIVVSASAITAAVVSACGVIGWVGLLVPHIARMLLGNDNRYCEPASMVLGGLFMLVTDTAARCMTASEMGNQGMKLELIDGSFAYEHSGLVLNQVSFSAEEGETVAVLGPNGIGKTTLLRCLLGFLKLQKGEIRINGRPRSEISDQEFWRMCAYVPQARSQTFAYTVEETVLMGRGPYLGFFQMPQRKDEEIAIQAMKEAGVYELRDQMLVMDEPETGLDFRNQLRVMDLIDVLSHQKGLTVILNTHYPDHACSIADRTLLLSDHSVQFGKTSEVLTEAHMEEAFGVEVHMHEEVIGGKNYVSMIPVALKDSQRYNHHSE